MSPFNAVFYVYLLKKPNYVIPVSLTALNCDLIRTTALESRHIMSPTRIQTSSLFSIH